MEHKQRRNRPSFVLVYERSRAYRLLLQAHGVEGLGPGLSPRRSSAQSPRSPATSPAQYLAGSGVGVSVLLRQPHGFEGIQPACISCMFFLMTLSVFSSSASGLNITTSLPGSCFTGTWPGGV